MFFLKCSANLFIRIVTIYTSFYADTILFYGRQVGNVDTFFLWWMCGNPSFDLRAIHSAKPTYLHRLLYLSL
jgi:hypothetical protein